jgi:hypothetical protein
MLSVAAVGLIGAAMPFIALFEFFRCPLPEGAEEESRASDHRCLRCWSKCTALTGCLFEYLHSGELQQP